MKRYLAVLGILLLLLSGCTNKIDNPIKSNPIKGQAIIDWIDFVQLNNITYQALYDGIISNPDDVTDEVVGEVTFRVAGVVTNPSYRTQNGDSGYLEEGTKLYQVKGFEPDQIIAAKVESNVNGYRIYASDAYKKTLNMHYPNMPKEKVNRIELYDMNKQVLFRVLEDEESKAFIAILEAGTDDSNFTPDQSNGDPTYYYMVFYTDEPFGYMYSIADDGKNVYFHPWDTRVVDQAIRKWLKTDNES